MSSRGRDLTVGGPIKLPTIVVCVPLLSVSCTRSVESERMGSWRRLCRTLFTGSTLTLVQERMEVRSNLSNKRKIDVDSILDPE